MTRLSAAVAVAMLRDSGIHIGPATLRQWKRRGHLSKGAGYNPGEILAYIDKRTEKAA